MTISHLLEMLAVHNTARKPWTATHNQFNELVAYFASFASFTSVRQVDKTSVACSSKSRDENDCRIDAAMTCFHQCSLVLPECSLGCPCSCCFEFRHCIGNSFRVSLAAVGALSRNFRMPDFPFLATMTPYCHLHGICSIKP